MIDEVNNRPVMIDFYSHDIRGSVGMSDAISEADWIQAERKGKNKLLGHIGPNDEFDFVPCVQI
jgi:hypothetical protein